MRRQVTLPKQQWLEFMQLVEERFPNQSDMDAGRKI